MPSPEIGRGAGDLDRSIHEDAPAYNSELNTEKEVYARSISERE